MSSLHSGHYLWPTLLTAALVSCGLTAQAQAEAEAEAEGFIDDASVNLNLRNYYINRNFTNPTYPQSKAEEWTQSFILDARSGFTQGTVGFGIDVLGLMAYKLDSGGGTTGTQLLPQTGSGSTAKRGAPDNFGRLGVAAKARISNTELKVGEWMVVLPILRSDDGRSLPQTFEGAQITAKEIEGLALYGGQMRGVSWRNSSDMEDMSFGGATSDRFNFAGGEYTFNEKRTMVGVWNAQLKDIYNQQYLNLVHSQALGGWTFGANLSYFIGKEDGSQRAGKLDNKTASGLFSARIGATPSSSAYSSSQVKPSGCGSAAQVVAPWLTICTTPASMPSKNVRGKCATTTTLLLRASLASPPQCATHTVTISTRRPRTMAKNGRVTSSWPTASRKGS